MEMLTSEFFHSVSKISNKELTTKQKQGPVRWLTKIAGCEHWLLLKMQVTSFLDNLPQMPRMKGMRVELTLGVH